MKKKLPKMPLGTKRAIYDAFSLAIDALNGQVPYIVLGARPRAAARLRRAFRKLLAEGYTHA